MTAKNTDPIKHLLSDKNKTVLECIKGVPESDEQGYRTRPYFEYRNIIEILRDSSYVDITARKRRNRLRHFGVFN